MSIALGNNSINAVYIGDAPIAKVYIGDNLVWEQTPPSDAFNLSAQIVALDADHTPPDFVDGIVLSLVDVPA